MFSNESENVQNKFNSYSSRYDQLLSTHLLASSFVHSLCHCPNKRWDFECAVHEGPVDRVVKEVGRPHEALDLHTVTAFYKNPDAALLDRFLQHVVYTPGP